MYDPAGYGGQIINLGQGWKVRIDNGFDGRHAHVYNDRESKGKWAQNENGSPHDQGSSSPGEPPGSVKKELKKKTGWDWDKKTAKYREQKQKGAKQKENTKKIATGAVVVGAGYLIYRGIRFLPSLLPPLWWTMPANAILP
ncbi:MAG TPA: hypothetical protein DD738_07475 [Ruminiclostridium sp.]|nr:hypothetical protein [Ruminiclostridium sp.]